MDNVQEDTDLLRSYIAGSSTGEDLAEEDSGTAGASRGANADDGQDDCSFEVIDEFHDAPSDVTGVQTDHNRTNDEGTSVELAHVEVILPYEPQEESTFMDEEPTELALEATPNFELESEIDVHFHVIVHPDFKWGRKPGHIFLETEKDQVDRHQLIPGKLLEDGSVVMEVQLPIGRINKLKYRYILTRTEEDKTITETFDNWSSKIGLSTWRCIEVNPHEYSGQVLHRYDGYMIRYDLTEPRRTFERALEISNPTSKEFFLSVESNDFTSNEFSNHIQNMRKCIDTWVVLQKDPELRQTCFKKAIREIIANIVKKLSDSKANKSPMDLVFTLAAVKLITDLKVKLYSDTNNKILELLQLIPNLDESSCVEYQELLSMLSTPRVREYGRTLRVFLASLTKGGDLAGALNTFEFLYCVPLLHFLDGDSQPFVSCDVLTNSQQDAVEEDQKLLENYIKGVYDHKRASTKLNHQTLRTLFRLDPLTFHTIVLLLKPEHLLQCMAFHEQPLHVLLTALVDRRIELNMLHQIMRHLLGHEKRIEDDIQNSLMTSDKRQIALSYRFSLEKLMTISIALIDWEGESVSQALFFIHLAYKTICLEIQERDDCWNVAILSKILIDWFSRRQARPNLENTGKLTDVLSDLMQFEFPKKEDNVMWQESLIRHLETQFNELEPGQVVQLYTRVVEKNIHKSLLDAITGLTMEHVEKALTKSTPTLSPGESPALGHVLERALFKLRPKALDGDADLDPQALIKFALDVPVLKHFYTIGKQILPGDCQEYLQLCSNALRDLLKGHASGTVSVSMLKVTHAQNQEFLSVLTAGNFLTLDVPTPEKLQQLNADHMKEVISFEIFIQNLHKVHAFCAMTDTVDTSNIDHLRCLNIVDRSVAEIKDLRRENSEIEMIAKRMLEMKNMIIFYDIWNSSSMQHLAETDAKPTVEMVWNRCDAEWNKVKRDLHAGTMSLNALRILLERVPRKDYEKELSLLIQNNTERMRQIQMSDYLLAQKDLAVELMKIKAELRLKGSFLNVDQLSKLDDPSVQISSITSGLIETAQLMSDPTVQEAKRSLLEMAKYKDVFRWLDENVPKQQEVSLFIHLALIAANDSEEIKKLQTLNEIVLGYAPIVYNLQPEDSFATFVDNLKLVTFSEDLLGKLEQIAMDIEWLNHLKNVHGETKLEVLKELENIHALGIFIVGSKEHFLGEDSLDCVRLIVPPSGGCPETRYSYNQIKDLQGNLMLLAGRASQGKNKIDRFVEMFDAVSSLATTFLKLKASGSILFDKWEAKFYCDEKKDVTTFIDFGLSEGKLTGLRRDADVLAQIKQIRAFMDKCLAEWRDHVTQRRIMFPILNHYTTSQLVALRRTIATFISNAESYHWDQGKALLQKIHAECKSSDLLSAIKSAYHSIEEKVNEAKKQELDEIADSEVDKKKQLLLDEGYSWHVIQNLVTEIGENEMVNLDIDELIWLCQDMQEKGEGNDSGHIGSFLEKETFDERYLEHIEHQEGNLRTSLYRLWSKYLSSVTTSVQDYLSIDHVGIILGHISNEHELNRPFPPTMSEIHPNLITCPQKDMILTLLSIYHDGQHSPLPQEQEVLLCKEKTAYEEAELLIRRATEDTTGRIFCLANINMLTYENALAVANAIEFFVQGKHSYRLVLLCSSESEAKSPIAAAFDQYRIQGVIVKPLRLIQEFVLHHLHGDFELGSIGRMSTCVVTSSQAGNGKSLWVKNQTTVSDPPLKIHTVPLYAQRVNVNQVVGTLLQHASNEDDESSKIIHIDIPYEMHEGVDGLLFNLVILNVLRDDQGREWGRREKDVCVFEMMTPDALQQVQHEMLKFMPTVKCCSPTECIDLVENPEPGYHQLMDSDKFQTSMYKTVYKHLCNRKPAELSERDKQFVLLNRLIGHFPVNDPSWSEIRHFVKFLSIQLESCENSSFCSKDAQNDLPGLSEFILKFMIMMAKELLYRSLPQISDSGNQAIHRAEDMPWEGLQQFQLTRLWETSSHPYIFFNPDGVTMTYMGFVVEEKTHNILDPDTKNVLMKRSMSDNLRRGLKRNGVNLNERFDHLERMERIAKLCMVMGNDDIWDPDETYVITTDNAKKMMAIHLRFRCEIPVVIMGETGCGKTHLVTFMTRLQQPKNGKIKVVLDNGEEVEKKVENLVLEKVHGSTTEEDILKAIAKAEHLARENKKLCPWMYTVLFLDEVNTTEALGLVKEAMCDNTVNGRPIDFESGLRIIAACNPYRRHSDETIEMLAKAGLGYRVPVARVKDTMGKIPMRHLVYRVQPLPQSMRPLVWDFGQLEDRTERVYIEEIVRRKLMENAVINDKVDIALILSEAQKYMRQQKDECSFVSLRDVERTMDVLLWFSQQKTLFKAMDRRAKKMDRSYRAADRLVRSLVLALGVCYVSSLQERKDEFLKIIKPSFGTVTHGYEHLGKEILLCQETILESMQIAPNIAKNSALRENVFMMVVCVQLKIPLFLVGKPGSSKSLAKVIVEQNLHVLSRITDRGLMHTFETVNMFPFQCSPLTTSEEIIKTFNKVSAFQKDQRLIACFVLDEIGLAEDSPWMPLKVLHSLLEFRSSSDEGKQGRANIAFIGISNWALDPAKMNRGIMVRRGSPSTEELVTTARDICSSTDGVFQHIEPLIEPIALAYTQVCEQAINELHEFFGLRDFYSLVKMVYGMAKASNQCPSWNQLEHAVLRNFGGLEHVNPLEVFREAVRHLPLVEKAQDFDNGPYGLLSTCICSKASQLESRYMLLIVEDYSTIEILQSVYQEVKDAFVIFGSSFPKDQEYTVICQDTNRIKMCVETGEYLLLAHLVNLYGSMYDLMNQYYMQFSTGKQYVSLGLGFHRVVCQVNRDFRLIVVARKEDVITSFPTPLLNRLEKHYVAASDLLSDNQKRILQKLQTWITYFTRAHRHGDTQDTCVAEDIFIGFHKDAAAAIAMQFCTVEQEIYDENEVLRNTQLMLIQCATPEAILGLKGVSIQDDERSLLDIYFRDQHHSSLCDYVVHAINKDKENKPYKFHQITTHSSLLSNKGTMEIRKMLERQGIQCKVLSLQSFHTEHQFCREVRSFWDCEGQYGEAVLLIQCDSGDANADLLASARYILCNECKESKARRSRNAPGDFAGFKYVFLAIRIPRVAGGCFAGFPGPSWTCVHLDELAEDPHCNIPIPELCNLSVASLMDNSLAHQHSCSSKMLVGEGHLDVDFLIKHSIHGAISIIKDQRDFQKSRKMIKRMLEIFSSQQEIDLKNVIKERVCLLLREREQQRMNPDLAKQWLMRDVAKCPKVKHAGTLRRLFWNYLTQRVTKMLGWVITFMDTNGNFDLLTRSSPDTWQYILWVGMLANFSLTPLKYQDLLFTKMEGDTRVTVTPDPAVRTIGSAGIYMKAEFPFSWVFKELIDNLIEQQIQREYEVTYTRETIRQIGILLKKSQHWKLLETAIMQAGIELIQISYLKDFVQMIYKPESDDHDAELEMVTYSIRLAMERIVTCKSGSAEPLSPEDFLPLIHLGERSIRNHLRIFSQIIERSQDHQVLEELARRTTANEASTPQSFSEMTLDLLTVEIIVEGIKPDVEGLRKRDKSGEWRYKVELLAPLINDVLYRGFNTVNKGQTLGDSYLRKLEEIKVTWERIYTVKRFADIVCPKHSPLERHFTKSGPNLWKKLKNANFKSKETMEQMTSALKLATKMTWSDVKDCPHCKNKLLEYAVLPCKHRICRSCLEQLRHAGDLGCSSCQKHYEPTPAPDIQSEKEETIVKIQTYKGWVNQFFMEVVSQKCFAGATPPEAAVIELLMEYISGSVRPRGSKHQETISIFSQDLQPTPVVCSVLLQLLLRYSIDNVRTFVVANFRQSRKTNVPYIELAIMYCKAIEEHYQNQEPCQTAHETRIGRMLDGACQDLMVENEEEINDENAVRILEGVAKLQYCLKAVGYLLEEVTIKGRRISEAWAQILTKIHDRCLVNEQTRFYLVRLIGRNIGVQILLQISATHEWILGRELHSKGRTSVDIFRIYGEKYNSFKVSTLQALLSSKFIPVRNIIDTNRTDEGAIPLELLLVFFVIGARNELDQDGGDVGDRQAIALLRQDMNSSIRGLLRNSDLANMLLTEPCPLLDIMPDHGVGNRFLLEAIIHFKCVMSVLRKPGFMDPITSIVSGDPALVNKLFPTMPEHKWASLFAILRRDDWLMTEVYVCPNDHPYAIGECGRPSEESKCPQCGVDIGGRGHVLNASNKKLRIVRDIIPPGHILGSPDSRSREVAPERKLSPASTAILRFIVNAAMLCATEKHLRVMRSFIRPPISEEEVIGFLWQHLKHDLHLISIAINRSLEETVTFMHLVIKGLVERQIEGEVEKIELLTSDDREEWEQKFTRNYITPLLNKMDDHLQAAHNRTLNDEDTAGHALLRLIFSGEDTENELGDGKLSKTPALWRYYPSVNIESLIQQLRDYNKSRSTDVPEAIDTNVPSSERMAENLVLPHQEMFPVLQLFLRSIKDFKTLCHLPAIVRLVEQVKRCYHRKIDRPTADNLKIRDFLDRADKDVRDQFEAFCDAWNRVHGHLCTHVVSGSVLPADLWNQTMTEDVPLSTLLPSERGRGFCTTLLLHYLTSTHNDIIDEFTRIAKSEPGPSVNLKDLSSLHVIDYDDIEFLPMVTSHFSYTLFAGESNQTVEVNFSALEQQVIQTYLRGKGKIDYQSEYAIYCEDLNNGKQFELLNSKIPQVSLATVILKQITESLDQHQITDTLSTLDIAIGFLVTVNIESEMTLHAFMTDLLQMPHNILPQKLRSCKLEHMKSLWLALSHERDKKAAHYKQEAFTSVDISSCKEALNEQQETGLKAALQIMNVEYFLNVLYEAIVLLFTKRDELDTRQFFINRNIPLGAALQSHLEEKDALQIACLEDGTFPLDISVNNACVVWKVVYTYIRSQEFSH